MPKLTKRLVDVFEPREDKPYEVHDPELGGFILRVACSGRKVYAVRYRTLEGGKRALKLGVQGVLTSEEARKRAREALTVAELVER